MAFKTERNLGIDLAAFGIGASFVQGAAVLTALAGLLTLALWPELGALSLVIALVLAAAILGLALRLPAGLLMRFYGAHRHDPASHQQAAGLVSELARRAALTRAPDLYVIPSTLISAFSIGNQSRSAIALTEGLMRQLTMREIGAVLAREVARIGLGDLFAFSVADLVTRAAQALYYVGLFLAVLNVWHLITGDELVSWWTVLLLIAMPLMLNLVQITLPRGHEYTADRVAALMTGDPLGLASALSRFDPSTGTPLDDILPPVPARKVPQPSLLRCPPPAEARINRLNRLETPPMPALDLEEGPRISLIGLGPIAMRPRYRWPGVWL
jgi:heat shock protein HtpX